MESSGCEISIGTSPSLDFCVFHLFDHHLYSEHVCNQTITIKIKVGHIHSLRAYLEITIANNWKQIYEHTH